VVAGEMQLNELGKQTHICRKMIETYHPHVVCDEFICMPNHIHGILSVGENNKKSPAGIAVGTDYICPDQKYKKDAYNASVQPANFNRCLSESLGSIIRGFKIGVTKFAQSNNIPFARQ
jgi:putative transposase